jgi:hypothetical protein
MEYLTGQEVRRGRADPAQLGEQRHLPRGRALTLGVPLPLELRRHLVNQGKPAALARELGLQAAWQRPAVAGPQGVEAVSPGAAGRLEVAHPLGHQQTFDPPRALDALLDQPLAFAAAATPVLLLGARHADHAADLPLAAMPCHQRAQQAGQVDAIGLASVGGRGG